MPLFTHFPCYSLEKWHHTQQIFEATKRPSTILNSRLGHPCLDIFMRALPFTFLNVDASHGDVVEVSIIGEAGGTWFIERQENGWRQIAETACLPKATATMSADTAWKVFTKRRGREAVLQQFADIQITGDMALGLIVLDMVSVMA